MSVGILMFGIAVVLAGSVFPAHAEDSALEQRLAQGKALAYDRNRGNCLSCHMMDDGEQPGNSAPPLLMMKARFPDRDVLVRQIWDAAERNPETVMPPYGRHQILSPEELEMVVDYIYSL